MIYRAVSKSFSEKRSREIFELLKDESHIHIIFNVLPNGRVMEVTFRQRPHPTLAAMNPNEFHRLEQNLKSIVRFDNDTQITENGFKWVRVEVTSFDFDDLIFVGEATYTHSVYVPKIGRPKLYANNTANALSRLSPLRSAPPFNEDDCVTVNRLVEFEITPQIRCMIYKAISRSFPKSRIRKISAAVNDNDYLLLSFIVLPDGTLQEVNFTYTPHPTLVMPCDKLYRFERNLKKFVKFEPHEFIIRTGYKWGGAEFTWPHDLDIRHCYNGTQDIVAPE